MVNVALKVHITCDVFYSIPETFHQDGGLPLMVTRQSSYFGWDVRVTVGTLCSPVDDISLDVSRVCLDIAYGWFGYNPGPLMNVCTCIGCCLSTMSE